jgi:hypothetical protein
VLGLGQLQHGGVVAADAVEVTPSAKNHGTQGRAVVGEGEETGEGGG